MNKVKKLIKRVGFLFRVSIKVFTNFGPKVFYQKLKTFIKIRIAPGTKNFDLNSDYQNWIDKTKVTQKELIDMKSQVSTFKLQPKISIILPVFNVEERWLRPAIDSVIAQIYPNWELCIADDASTEPHIKPLLEEYLKKDKRIKVNFLTQNQHISGSSNEAIKIATGEFIALMDNDDEIEPYALYEFVKAYNLKNGELDFVYSDEDQMEIDGKRINPILKPDWSPEMTLSMMYTTHLGFYRKSIIDEIGGFRKGFEGSQDYDLVLRFTEKTSPERIHHIPKVLYHWRRIPGSTAEFYDAKPYAKIASRKALEDTIARRNLDAIVEDGKTSPSFHIMRKIRNNPKVSIIIPTKDKIEYVKKCVESIEKDTDTPGFTYEIIIVDNNSVEQASLDFFEKIKEKHIVLKYSQPFNYSAINNFAVKHSTGDYILLLNNDTAVIKPNWLYEMLQQAQEPGIGCVGAKLLFPNDTIQHAGVYIHENGVGGHIYHGFWRDSSGYMDRIQIVNNVSAVTGACLLVKKSIFEEVGQLDENLKVAFNDVDLCLKILDKGYRNVYTPFATLYHFESLTRGPEDTPEKVIRFNKEKEYVFNKWRKYLIYDHYYNPNLVLNNGVLSFNYEVKKLNL